MLLKKRFSARFPRSQAFQKVPNVKSSTKIASGVVVSGKMGTGALSLISFGLSLNAKYFSTVWRRPTFEREAPRGLCIPFLIIIKYRMFIRYRKLMKYRMYRLLSTECNGSKLHSLNV
jgi:hypothetical protein